MRRRIPRAINVEALSFDEALALRPVDIAKATAAIRESGTAENERSRRADESMRFPTARFPGLRSGRGLRVEVADE